MKALLLSVSLAQPIASEPKICLPEQYQTAQTLTCCTETSGRQCCSKSVNDNGEPLGCDCD
jgi:hypothetical protein